MQIRSDAAGLGSDWHLAQVVVKHQLTGECVTFPFNNWIGEKAGTQHTLHPEGSLLSTQALVAEYDVIVYTSDRKGAGTDSEVLLEIQGECGIIGKQVLKGGGRNYFERGRVDRFLLSGQDIGALLSVRFHDPCCIFGSFSQKFLENTLMYTKLLCVVANARVLVRSDLS